MHSDSALSIVPLVFKALFIVSSDSSVWNTCLIWLLRLITISVLFRTFLGPTILRLITKRLRVRSVSLRSIRGIYFHAGKAIVRIDRVGLSYHRRSTETASRFSIKVEGLKVEILKRQVCESIPSTTSTDSTRSTLSSKFPVSPILQSFYWNLYAFLDPYVRPLVRYYFVSALRVAIRALPALTQVLDLELVDAVAIVDNIDGAHINLRGASLSTSIKLSQIHVPPDPQESKDTSRPGHKRFKSVAEWNARLKSSLRRSWDRAWGALEAHASITLKVEEISGMASKPLLDQLSISSSGRSQSAFLKAPQFTFALSACLDSRHGIQQHSLEVGLNLDSITMDLFVLTRIADLLKTPPPVNPMVAASLAALRRDPSRSGSGPRVGWASSMSVLTASMRFRRGLKKPPVRKLDTRAIASKLSMLKGIQVNVNRITLKHQMETGLERNLATLSTTLRRVNIYAALSDPESNPLHREWLGKKSSRGGDPLNPHTYEFGFTIRDSALDRIGSGTVSDHLRLLELGPITAEAVASQWPASWLRGTSFFAGDPNSQVLLVQVSLDKIHVTERLEVLQAFIAHRKPAKPAPPRTKPLIPDLLSPVPRIQVGVHVGSVCGRLIYPTPEVDGKPFALQLRTDGLQFTAQSHFSMLRDDYPGYPQVDSDYPRLKMNFDFHLVLQRTFVTVSMGVYAEFDEHVTQPAADEPVFSLDVLQMMGDGEALGHLQEVPGTIVSLHTPSLYMQTHVFADALSIELWQPDAINALSTIARALQSKPTASTKPPSPPLLDQIPPGIDFSLSIARLMVYVTGKDLAPDDDLGISRGIAASTGVYFQCCSLRPHHTRRMTNLLDRREKRLKLSLPVELTSVAQSRMATPIPDLVTTFVQAKLFDVAVRNSIATPVTADEPYDFEESRRPDPSKEFFTIREIVAQAAINGHRVEGSPSPDTLDDCHASVNVSRVRGTLHLAQIYNVLLAANTMKKVAGRLKRPKPSLSPTHPKTMNVTLSYTVDPVHLLWDFPMKSRLYIRLRSLFGQVLPSGSIGVSWKSAVFATTVESEKDDEVHVRWEEVLRLLNFDIEVRPSVKPLGITVTGDSGRIRIPYGFVIADLILDINISIKCVKHLVHMVPSGQYSNPPTPEAEDAKNMPDLEVRIKCLSAEAADEEQETRLGLIWRAGSEAARLRQEREEAFQAKVATIIASETNQRLSRELDSDFQFSAAHSVTVEDARERLNVFHAGAWKSRFRQAHVNQQRREGLYRHKNGGDILLYEDDQADLVHVENPPAVPPLFRITLEYLSLRLSGPSFPLATLPDFLFNEGEGLPRSTEYSLLVPMHLNFSVSSLRVAYREYPLPLLNIPAHSDEDRYSLEFDSDVVIAEEMGTPQSVYWVDCVVLSRDFGLHGTAPMSIPVPKTIMPVKSYAKPMIRVTTDNVSDFGWGGSYGPATQDFMRVMDTLSHAPRDSSPPIGFWDKLKLVFHWRFRVHFDHDVHFHMKGSRDPHNLRGNGAGFALCWKGQPRLLIGQPNEQDELIQVISDTMLVIIPNVEEAFGSATSTGTQQMEPTSSGQPQYHIPERSSQYRKVCAKFTSGVRFGIGIGLERACGDECQTCTGRPFQRKCRFFEFRPHYEVMLEQKCDKPTEKSINDSYNGFRSDFIHLSVSLTSAVNHQKSNPHSSIHLSPKLFAHFWSWWTLFDFKAPPIRQGRRYKQKRPLSPKFGQHLATIKYRIAVPKLFISHVYMDESSDAWADGVTPFVGVKAMIEMFQADMHQRAQESTITKPNGGTKTVVHKPFYAVEVVMKDLDLRTLLAIYSDTLKEEVPLESSPLGSSYRTRKNLPAVSPDSVWLDLDDFLETDWSSAGIPILHLLPVVSCPRFTYFRRSHDRHVSGDRIDVTKFGNEDTHVCLLNTEASVPQVQLQLAEKRIVELQNIIMINGQESRNAAGAQKSADARKMLPLLEDYVKQLHKDDAHARRQNTIGRQSYYMPSDSVSPEEWSEFSNVYQVHCPQVFMDNIIRDILLQYYYCSRARRGMEYHMASRAVKFIRDQAQMILESSNAKEGKGRDSASDGVRAAADAVRRIFGVDGARMTVEPTEQPSDLQHVDPLSGWSEGVALRKSHFCLLLKPQFVLRSETDEEAVCIMTAVQGKLQSYNIMDIEHADDPISGNILTRNFASITGLQTFCPSATNKGQEGCVPLEVMVDLRCDNSLFDRLVPQTDAIFQYDKFNRLRLQMQSKGVSVTRPSTDHPDPMHDHLHNQTDLVRFHVPRFTISANDRHFQALSTIITNLLLFSDTASKIRTDRLDKMIFSYDFTDLSSAADVVASLQARLRHAVDMKKEAQWKLQGYGDDGQIEKLRIDAHILMLTEELDLVFDAIRLAQEKAEDRASQKSALLLHASSSEISYRMLDHHDQLLAKLAVRKIDFHWLNRQDSSTVNNLSVGDLQAFDGAADAEWTEILSKCEEKSNHPSVKDLVQRDLFLLADWTVLPPVGGITIYEAFEVTLHPIRLQIDTRVGRRIMEYVWPARRDRNKAKAATKASGETKDKEEDVHLPRTPVTPVSPTSPRRNSADAIPSSPRLSFDANRLAPPPMRRVHTSRSFTDLRKMRNTSGTDSLQVPGGLQRTKSSDMLFGAASSSSSGQTKASDEPKDKRSVSRRGMDDASEMKYRSSQKTFIWVKVASLHLLLSIMKENSFLCNDARIRTRDLEYRNQTWSFEELVDQFIPSGRNWKGWVKMAFQQPLVPVLPVARELISKTKWGGAKPHHNSPGPHKLKRKETAKLLEFLTPHSREKNEAHSEEKDHRIETPERLFGIPLASEPEPVTAVPVIDKSKKGRARVLSMFKRQQTSPHKVRASVDSDVSVNSTSSASTNLSSRSVPSLPLTVQPQAESQAPSFGQVSKDL